MSNIMFLTLEGQQQGLISQGCGSQESISLNWQVGHEDDIFVYAAEFLFSINIRHYKTRIYNGKLNFFQDGDTAITPSGHIYFPPQHF